MKLFDKLYNQLFFKYYKVKYGDNLNCIGRLIIQGHGNYQLGNGVTIISKATVNPIGGDRTVLQTIAGGEIRIGNRVGMSHVVLSSRAQICIEDNVMLGGGVKIFDHDFHSIFYEERIEKGDSHVHANPVLIKEGAFIGAHTIILKGATIGKHSVIGAGSVVTGNIPDNEIWAGNPVRFIRRIEP